MWKGSSPNGDRYYVVTIMFSYQKNMHLEVGRTQ